MQDPSANTPTLRSRITAPLQATLLFLVLALAQALSSMAIAADAYNHYAVSRGVGQPLKSRSSGVSYSPKVSAKRFYQWGRQFEHGEGRAKDPERAVQMYCSAAAKGYAPAQYALGWMYANGRGVKQDDNLAAAWLRKAARNGDQYAARLLRRVRIGNRSRAARCVLPSGHNWWPVPKNAASPDHSAILKLVNKHAPRYGLDTNLVVAVIRAESNFNANARSHKNAQGLMQLIPSTARRFGVENAYDPEQNIKGGMAYLKWLLEYFKGDVELALAGYNAGEDAVVRYSGIPPYPETQAYVRRIMRDLQRSS